MAEQKKRPKGASSAKSRTAPAITDPRFMSIQTDPRYRLPSRRQTRVKLDKRFAHMLHDRDFSRNAAVDRYGRQLARDDTKTQLKRFYRLDEDDEASDKGNNEGGEEDRKEMENADGQAYDPARDGGFSSSSSSEEESSSDEEEEDVGVGESAEELDYPSKQETNVPLGEVTSRLAAVNLDWDNIRAEDLMAVFTSFVPTGGRVQKVSIYPSEFGKERMEQEETEGPPREIFASNGEKDSDFEEEEAFSDDEDRIKQSLFKADNGEEFNSTQLRRYQLERLRYFYAILTFSSKDAAKYVYDQVDGAEYLSSANFFDLRFVPDDTDFSEDKPRDECEHIPDGYKPNDFVTDALQHSKVKLTWDADDSSRKEAQARAFRGSRKDINENDLRAYVGSDSSEDEEDDVEAVDATKVTVGAKLSKKEIDKQRMRALLGLSAEPSRPRKSDNPVGEMEVTFTSGLAGGTNKDDVFENELQCEETTIDRYLRKERERKKRRKDKLKATNENGPVQADDKKQSGSKASGEERKDEEEEDLGFDDPFFDNPDNKTVSSSRRKKNKREKREKREAAEAASATQRAELELLMLDDKNSTIKHFDMNEIEKTEKAARKKKGKGEDIGTNSVQDEFKIDVNDPRFGRLYESHEFAIDPTNPRFKATQNMKALLEEGRKRRRGLEGRDELEGDLQDGNKRRKDAPKENQQEDLKRLVDRVKRKTEQTINS